MLDDTQRTCCIQGDYYGKYELRKIIPESKYLSEEECVIIHDILSKYKLLFDETQGNQKIKPIGI